MVRENESRTVQVVPEISGTVSCDLELGRRGPVLYDIWHDAHRTAKVVSSRRGRGQFTLRRDPLSLHRDGTGDPAARNVIVDQCLVLLRRGVLQLLAIEVGTWEP
jgi:hypothetical protein